MMHAVTPVLLRLPDVERMTSIKRSTIYKLEGEGKFPRRIQLGGRMVAWVTTDVRDWIAAKIAASESLAA